MREVSRIYSMPIMDEMGEDKQCWKFTTHGNYTICISLYHGKFG